MSQGSLGSDTAEAKDARPARLRPPSEMSLSLEATVSRIALCQVPGPRPVEATPFVLGRVGVYVYECP